MQVFWKLFLSMTNIKVSQVLLKFLYIHGHCFPLARLTYPSSDEEWLPNSNCREHTRNKANRMRVQGPKPHLAGLKQTTLGLLHGIYQTSQACLTLWPIPTQLAFYLLIETTLQPQESGEWEGFCTWLNGGITQANPWKNSLELYIQKRWRPC